MRASADRWETKDSLPGPPLSRSTSDLLSEAGVLYGVALNTDSGTKKSPSPFKSPLLTSPRAGPPGDSRIQSLALEAAWAAKYAGLSEHEALALVSTNVETILGLEANKDVVVWEGSPLAFGTPVLAFQHGGGGGRLEVASCWPNEADE